MFERYLNIFADTQFENSADTHFLDYSSTDMFMIHKQQQHKYIKKILIYFRMYFRINNFIYVSPFKENYSKKPSIAYII